MNRTWILAGIFFAAATMSSAQTSPQAPSGTSGSSATTQAPAGMQKPQADTAAQSSGPAIPAALARSVDSKKAKPGDEIDAKTVVSVKSGSGIQIPEGSKIVGHITEAKSRAKGDPESSLAFSFEKIVLKNGQELPFRAVAQAIGLAENPAAAAFPENGGPNAQPQPMGAGGQAGSAGSAAGTQTAAESAETTQKSSRTLPENATGVVGLKGLTLNSQPESSVVSSESKSVKLDSGTQMLLRVFSQ